MQMRDYLVQYDSLAAEEVLYEIPVRKEYVLSRIGKGKRVLDVGCLGGKFTQLIQEQNNDVWGVEVNPRAAELAKRRGLRVKLANADDGLPFSDQEFDAVNAGEVVEHLYDTKFFFEEVWRVLKRNGIFLFSTPNVNSLENRIRVATGKYPSMVGAYPEDHFGEHVRILNLDKIYELCEQTGFQVKDVRGVPVLQSWGKWVDTPLTWMGKIAPRFSKLLLVTAQKAQSDGRWTQISSG